MTKDAKPDAWMPLYIGDWDSGTRHLDCEQDGAYGRLVRHYWKNGPLPDDDAQLARIVGMDGKRWKKTRPVLAAFFVVGDGIWRHNRVDAELVRWADKRRRAIEKARLGGLAKAGKKPASSTASSTPQALLKHCTSASAFQVDSPTGYSTLKGQNDFMGPEDVREAFAQALGEEWVRSYLDRSSWQDVPERAIIPSNSIARQKFQNEARKVLAKLSISILERAA